MNIKELKEVLAKYPDDMEVLYCLHSDYEMMQVADIREVKGVWKGAYTMRSHPTMSAENKANENTYVLFPGN